MKALEQVRRWKHVFKLDPEREMTDETLEQICLSGTDAVIVGGSSGITYENTVELLSRVRRYTVSCGLEISDQDAIVPGFDVYFIPIVLNSRHSDWIVGHHQRAIKTLGTRLPWDLVVAEGYVILNEDCTAARLTDAQTSLDVEDMQAYARLAESVFSLPICYVEYSGVFGDMALVRSAARDLDQTRLFYGGGIRDKHTAEQAAAVADTIVVGNAVYEDLRAALETVAAVMDKRG